jgi:hypothetical protein
MFRSRDQHALAHQAGGVAHLLNVPPTSGDREAVEIGADKYDAGGRRSRKDSDPDRHAGMEAYADCFDGPLDRSFEAQGVV